MKWKYTSLHEFVEYMDKLFIYGAILCIISLALLFLVGGIITTIFFVIPISLIVRIIILMYVNRDLSKQKLAEKGDQNENI